MYCKPGCSTVPGQWCLWQAAEVHAAPCCILPAREMGKQGAAGVQLLVCERRSVVPVWCDPTDSARRSMHVRPGLLQQQLVHLVGADVHHLEDARALELLVDISIDRGTPCRVQVVSGTACCRVSVGLRHSLLQHALAGPASVDSVHICSLPIGERYSCA